MEKNNPIPLSRCFCNDEIQQAALRALTSGRYILADECAAFEKELAAHTGSRHAVLSTSWTMVVYMLHKIQGLGKGDEVIVPSHTAFPTIEPLIHLGAKPVFVDVDDFYCMDPDAVAAAITPRTVGIIPVHIYGHPANLDALMALAKKHHLWLMEDCAQAQGAKHSGRTVGGIGDFGAFSFYPSKNLTVLGDGGFLSTNNSDVDRALRMLRNHGRQSKFTHEFVGYNLRFNEVQAAVGRVGLKNLDRLNEGRRRIAAIYSKNLPDAVTPPAEAPYATHVYHMYVIRCAKRDELGKFLKERGIETGIHYPVANHQQPAVTALFPGIPKLERTEKLVGEIISLPIHGEMAEADALRVCEAVTAFYAKS
jgi:dTDP-4-amino-4,6-dideoxygalactose transaminase